MQSARLPLRQMDSNATPSPDPEAAARRRSGRVVRAPDKFAPDASQAAAKRKRDDGEEDDGDDAGADDDENEVPELDDESDEGEDQESDDEPARAKRAKKSSQSQRARKPSAKKPKINGTQPSVGTKTVTLPRMPKKAVRLDTAGTGTGLYGTAAAPRRLQWKLNCMIIMR
jgi:cohesin complex subunit SA-1/2